MWVIRYKSRDKIKLLCPIRLRLPSESDHFYLHKFAMAILILSFKLIRATKKYLSLKDIINGLFTSIIFSQKIHPKKIFMLDAKLIT